jgi:hypothetical protein
MAATCDLLLAQHRGLDQSASRATLATEIALLQNSAVTHDTIAPLDQRQFLDLHRAMAGMPAPAP